MVDPLGVDGAPPRLSWQLRGEGRGLRQTAWRVVVASSPGGLSRDAGDVWDSGRVESAEQLHVPFDGRALRSAEQVFWKVRVWDGEGRASSWSEPSTWTMGVLEPEAWRGRFVTDPDLVRRVRPRLGFKSEETETPDAVKWLQVDLGGPRPVQAVRFHAVRHTVAEKLGFPPRFKVEIASRPDFEGAVRVADYTDRDYDPWPTLIEVPVGGTSARYVRLTANRLRVFEGKACLALSQVEVVSGGRNVAVGAAVTASDSVEEAPWSAASVTDGLGVPGANSRANDTLLLRRGLRARPGLRRALANVCGLGHYEMTVNGKRVGTGLLTPGWTDYTKTCLYDTHDVTSLLRPGENAVGLFLGGGMYNVQEGRYVKFVSAFRPLAALAQLRLEYEDGSVETVGTDTEWRVSPGPIVFSNVYGGEDYDARREVPGWDEPGFDDSRWPAAVEAPGVACARRGASQASPAFRTYEELKPRSQTELRPGVSVYDFGQNASMMPRLRVRGPAGASVKIIPAELLKADGSVDRTSVSHGAVEASWSYTLAGRSEGESYFPRFFYHGSRYLQVERQAPPGGRLPDVESLESVVVHSDSPPAGEFSCSSELFNRIRTLVRWAQRSNLAHVITDCPHRERLGWLEQYHLNGPSLRYETDLARLYAKGFADMADAQQPNGLVPDIAPEYIAFEGGFRDSPEWGSAIVLAAWQHYVWTGDDRPLRRNYEAMQRYVAYLASRAEGHIVGHGLGDWYDLGPNPPGYSQLTPIALTATALYLEDVQALARIAERLGREDDARASLRPRAGDRRRLQPEVLRSDREGLRGGLPDRPGAAAGAGTRPRRGSGRRPGGPGAGRARPRQRDDRRGRGIPLRPARPRGGRALRRDLRHEPPERAARLRLPARAGRHVPDRGVGRKPALLAEPLHARPDRRVALRRARGPRSRPVRPRLRTAAHPPPARSRHHLGAGRPRLAARAGGGRVGAEGGDVPARGGAAPEHVGRGLRPRPRRAQPSREREATGPGRGRSPRPTGSGPGRSRSRLRPLRVHDPALGFPCERSPDNRGRF